MALIPCVLPPRPQPRSSSAWDPLPCPRSHLHRWLPFTQASAPVTPLRAAFPNPPLPGSPRVSRGSRSRCWVLSIRPHVWKDLLHHMGSYRMCSGHQGFSCKPTVKGRPCSQIREVPVSSKQTNNCASTCGSVCVRVCVYARRYTHTHQVINVMGKDKERKAAGN